MDFMSHLEGFYAGLMGGLPQLLESLIILLFGWLICSFVAWAIRAVIEKLPFMDKLAGTPSGKKSIAKNVGDGVFFFAFLFVLLAFFEKLGLTVVTTPINNFLTTITEFLPRIFGSGVLALVAWLVGTLVKKGITTLGNRVELDNKLSGEGDKPVQLTASLANTGFALTMVLFLPAILGTLALQGILDPVNSLVDQITAYVPRLFSAGILAAIGVFVARLFKNLAVSGLQALNAGSSALNAGFISKLTSPQVSGVLGQVVFAVVLFPILVSAVDVLGIDAISKPTKDLFASIVGILPNLLAGGLFIGLGVAAANFVKNLLQPVLNVAGVGKLVQYTMGQEVDAEKQASIANTLSSIAFYVITLLVLVQGFELIGLSDLSAITEQILGFGTQVLVGAVVFLAGLVLASLASKVIATNGSQQASIVSNIARFAVLFLFGAMALRQMGLANDIINLGFGLLLGALALAFALSVGLGTRDIAARELSGFIDRSKQH